MIVTLYIIIIINIKKHRDWLLPIEKKSNLVWEEDDNDGDENFQISKVCLQVKDLPKRDYYVFFFHFVFSLSPPQKKKKKIRGKQVSKKFSLARS